MRLTRRAPLCLICAAALCCIPAASDAAPAPKQAKLDAAAAKGIDAAIRLLAEDRASSASQIAGSAVGRTRVTEAILGAAILAHPERKRWARELRRVRVATLQYVRDGSSMQESWPLAAAGLFLTLSDGTSRVERRAVEDLVYRIEEAQNEEGGWGHDARNAGMSDSSYPATLMAATVQSLAVLGLLASRGADVDDDVIQAGLKLAADVQSKTGALPYGGRAYRKGYEAGRSCALLLALDACGRRDSEMYRRAHAFATANVALIPKGHASCTMHVLWGALSMCAAGPKSWSLYAKRVLSRVLAGQTSDGAFRALEGGTSDDMALIGTAEGRAAYVTACSAAALLAPRMTRITKRDGTEIEQPSSSKPVTTAPRPAATWHRKDIAATAICAGDAGRLLVASRAPLRLHALDAQTGRDLHPAWTAPAELSRAHPGTLRIAGDGSVLLTLQEVVDPEIKSRRTSLGGGRFRHVRGPEVRHRVLCLELPAGEVRWSAVLEHPPHRMADAGGALHVLLPTGAVSSRDLRTGERIAERHVPGLMTNGGLAALDDGGALVGTDTRIDALPRKGKARWTRSARRDEARSVAAITSAHVAGAQALVTAADGGLLALKVEDGTRTWMQELHTAPDATALAPFGLVVFGHDDRVRCVDVADGSVRWVQPIGHDRASHVRSGLSTSVAHVLVTSARSGEIVVLRGSDGKPAAAIRSTRGDVACLLGHHVFVGSPGRGVRAHVIPSGG